MYWRHIAWNKNPCALVFHEHCAWLRHVAWGVEWPADASLEHCVAKVGCCSLIDKAVLGLLMQTVQLVQGKPVWLLVVAKEVEDANQLIVRPVCFACWWWKSRCHSEGHCRTYGVVGWADQINQWADTNRLPYYGHTCICPVAIGPLLTQLDGQWTGELYLSPDYWMYSCTHSTVQCAPLLQGILVNL